MPVRNDAIIATDRSGSPAAPVAARGFYYHWGPQAWIDMWMSRKMLLDKAMPIISHTFVPILRLSGDSAQVDRDYADIRSRREVVRALDSPRERWRKRYGNFVREMEWALLELRRYYSREQYDEIVIGTAVALSRENASGFLEMMNSMPKKNRKRRGGAEPGDGRPGRWTRLMFEAFNPAHWLTGTAELRQFDPANGLTVIEIPECGWHTCAAADSLPNPRALPEEGCLAICKGAFEALFDGADGGLRMEFEPHLPKTSCTVRMSWHVQHQHTGQASR